LDVHREIAVPAALALQNPCRVVLSREREFCFGERERERETQRGGTETKRGREESRVDRDVRHSSEAVGEKGCRRRRRRKSQSCEGI
jgi:hypothetical protein